MPFAAEPRSHAGNGAFYRNDSGNNDIDLVKVARDDDTVYFYAKTRNPMEMGVGRVNMFLYIGIVGREYAPHWHYFHYLVNQIVMDGNTTVLQTSKGGYRWGDNRRVSYRKEGNEIMVAIPRELLGLEKEAPFALHFKWVDHVGLDHTIEEFYENGDTAPFGRFSYLYEG